MSILEAINLQEFVPIVVLIVLLTVVGDQMIAPRPELIWWASSLAAAAFILYSLMGLAVWPLTCAWDAVVIVLRAMLASGLVWAIAKIVLPAIATAYEHTIGNYLQMVAIARREELAKARQGAKEKAIAEEEQDRMREKERRELETRNAPKPQKPIPPTPQQIAEAAETRYQERLAIIEKAALDHTEREAARLKAKQQLLRDLDKAL